MKKIKKMSNYSNVANIKTTLPEVSTNTILNMNQQLVSNVNEATDPSDGLNIFQTKTIINNNIQNIINNNFTIFVPLSGTLSSDPITGNLIFSNNSTITGLQSATNPTDAINYSQFKKYLSDNFIPISGTIPNKPITGDIFLNNTNISNIADPINDTDAIQFKTLKNKLTKYLPLSGGTINAQINMNGNTITNIYMNKNNANAFSKKSLNNKNHNNEENIYPVVNLSYVNSLFSYGLNSFLNYSGNTSKNPITGDLIFTNKTISNIADPINNTDAIQFKTLKDKVIKYFPLHGGTLKSILDMNHHKIINVPDSTNDSNLVNLNTCNATIEKINSLYANTNIKNFNIKGNITLSSTGKISGIAHPKENSDIVNLYYANKVFSNYVSLNNGTLKGTLNMNDHSINNVNSNPLNPNDGVNLEKMTSSMSEFKAIPLTGTTSNNPITGNLFLKNTKIINVIDPINNEDIVNLKTLNTKFSSYFSLLGGTIIDLDMNSFEITNVKNAINPEDAINYGQMKSFTNNYIQLNSPNDISNSLYLNNTLIKNLPNPKNNTDVVNLAFLETSLSSFLSSSGDILNGPINMNKNLITNLGNGEERSDAANYGQLPPSLIFYNKTTKGSNINFSWKSNSGIDFSIDQGAIFSIQDYQSYFNVSATKLFILNPGVYLFNIHFNFNNLDYLAKIGSFITSPSLGTAVHLNNCIEKNPQNISLSVLLPLDEKNISNNNTYLEILNLGENLSISQVSWNIYLINTLDI